MWTRLSRKKTRRLPTDEAMFTHTKKNQTTAETRKFPTTPCFSLFWNNLFIFNLRMLSYVSLLSRKLKTNYTSKWKKFSERKWGTCYIIFAKSGSLMSRVVGVDTINAVKFAMIIENYHVFMGHNCALEGKLFGAFFTSGVAGLWSRY